MEVLHAILTGHVLAQVVKHLAVVLQQLQGEVSGGVVLTDVLVEGSYLFYIGSDDTLRYAFSAEPHENELFLPGVMSRKKQIIPNAYSFVGLIKENGR